VISVENRNIFPPRVFCAPADRVPVGIGYRRMESKKLYRMMELTDGQKLLRYV